MARSIKKTAAPKKSAVGKSVSTQRNSRKTAAGTKPRKKTVAPNTKVQVPQKEKAFLAAAKNLFSLGATSTRGAQLMRMAHKEVQTEKNKRAN